MVKLKRGSQVKMTNPGSPKKYPIVRVCIPYYDGLPEPAVMLNEQLIQWGIPGYDVHVHKQQSTIIQFARNEMVEEDGAPYEYIFFVDSDVGFSNQILKQPTPNGLPIMIDFMKRILDHKLNICGGVYPKRKPPHEPTVYRHIGGTTFQTILDFPDEGVEEVGGLATGFLCIKKEVFVRMRKHLLDVEKKTKAADKAMVALTKLLHDLPPDMPRYNNIMDKFDILKKGYEHMDPALYPPFWLKYINDPFQKRWRFMGEDLFFCMYARQLGFKIYCDFSVQLGHQSIYFADPGKYKLAYKDDCIARYNRGAKIVGLPAHEEIDSFVEVKKSG